MTDVDVSKIKVGDVVGVEVVEVSLPAASCRIKSDPDYLGMWITASAIVSHTPVPKPSLKAGDRVRDPSGVELEIVGAPRASAANGGRPEITTWSQKHGYVVDVAAEVEQWERV